MKLKIYNRELIVEEGLSLNIFKGKDNEIEVEIKLIDDENEYITTHVTNNVSEPEVIDSDIDKRENTDSVKIEEILNPVDVLFSLAKSDKYKYNGFNIVDNKIYISEIFDGYDNDYIINKKNGDGRGLKLREEVKEFVTDCRNLGIKPKTISNNSNIPLNTSRNLFTKINRSIYGYNTPKLKDYEIEEIKNLRLNGVEVKDIAKKFGISITTVYNHTNSLVLRGRR